MPQPRSTTYRSAGLSQGRATQYIGNAFVYVLASRIDPNLCKIGKGNPTARCDHWNINSPHGGILNNNLSVFAVYSFNTEAEALEYESQAHAIYNFVNLNPNAAGGEQEFFGVPPQQAKATLDILHSQATRVARARQDAFDNAPIVIAQREQAQREQAQREAAAARAKSEATEIARQEAAYNQLYIQGFEIRGVTPSEINALPQFRYKTNDFETLLRFVLKQNDYDYERSINSPRWNELKKEIKAIDKYAACATSEQAKLIISRLEILQDSFTYIFPIGYRNVVLGKATFIDYKLLAKAVEREYEYVAQDVIVKVVNKINTVKAPYEVDKKELKRLISEFKKFIF